MSHPLPLGRPARSLTLPGLTPPTTLATPAARRAWLRALPDDALLHALTRWMETLANVPRADVESLAAWVRAPLGEVMASPFGLRACALGAKVGGLVVHHELRTLLPWPDDLVGDVATLDINHGEWQRGGLHAGRYQSFQLDGAFATYHPDHSARWTPHELLHRAVGYGWRAGMSRWETYQCARLAELLPVVHWYGPDLLSRLDENEFTQDSDALTPSAPLARARWLHASPDVRHEHLAQTMRYLREGIDRFDAEFAACSRELEEGRAVSVPHGLLDSKADATAYVAGHHPRLTAERLTCLLNTGGPAPHARGARSLADQVERCFDALLFGSIEVDADELSARAHGRLLWDLAHRAVHLSDWDPSAFVPALTAAWAAASEGDPTPAVATMAAVLDDLPAYISSEVSCVGLIIGGLPGGDGVDRDQLTRGIESAAPATLAWLQENDHLEQTIDALIKKRQRGPLIVRLADATPADPVGDSLLAFETALVGATRRDDVAERLAEPITAPLRDGYLRPSVAFTELSLPIDAAELAHAMVTGSPRPDVEEACAWLVGETGAGVAVISTPPGLLEWWRALPLPAVDAMAALRRAEDRDALGGLDAVTWLTELSGASAIAWLPSIQ